MSIVFPKSTFTLIFSENEDSILLVRRKDIPVWEAPGGTIDVGETKQQAAIREVKEETGYDIALTKTLGLFYSKFSLLYPCLIYKGKILSGTSNVSVETSAIQFFKIDHLPKYVSPFVTEALAIDKRNSSKKLFPLTFRQFFNFLTFGLKNPKIFFFYILSRNGIYLNLH